MVQVQKAEKKAVYRYILQEGVIVLHKDFTTQAHKGTNIPNIHVRILLRSLKDRGFVELVFNWQYYYYFINAEGKKHLSEYLGLTEEVVPLTWKSSFFYLERTKKDNTNTSSKTVARRLEEKETTRTDLKANAEEEEGDLEAIDPTDPTDPREPIADREKKRARLLTTLRSQLLRQPQPHDLFANLIFRYDSL
jgi:hypothetical protein